MSGGPKEAGTRSGTEPGSGLRTALGFVQRRQRETIRPGEFTRERPGTAAGVAGGSTIPEAFREKPTVRATDQDRLTGGVCG
jgi:hypothetical protein